MSVKIMLDWPHHDLHPNARVIWQVKQIAVRNAREMAKYCAISTLHDMADTKEDLEVVYTFCPPNKAHRDLDNLVANMKPAMDGIMDALRTNDNQIKHISAQWGNVVRGGTVEIEVKRL